MVLKIPIGNFKVQIIMKQSYKCVLLCERKCRKLQKFQFQILFFHQTNNAELSTAKQTNTHTKKLFQILFNKLIKLIRNWKFSAECNFITNKANKWTCEECATLNLDVYIVNFNAE